MSFMLKNVYFIRHAESLGNVAEVQQHAGMDLSEHGHTQAATVALRFTKIPIDLIISSDILRAEKTARTIAKKIGKEIIFSPLFRERKRPTRTQGIYIHSEEAKALNKTIIEHFDDPNWHDSDEENFFDMRTRAREAVGFLEDCDEASILVVTHGVFLKVIIGTMIDPDITPQQFLRLMHFLIPQNTGITWCQKGHPKAVDPNIWQMVTWNDHAHLG